MMMPPPHRDLELWGFAVRLARRAAAMDDREGVMQAFVMMETAFYLINWRTGLAPAQMRRELEEAEAWAAAQPPFPIG